MFSVCVLAQPDMSNYRLVYSTETPQQALEKMPHLSDAELDCCASDFTSMENLERSWKYEPKGASIWNRHMATNADDRAEVHILDEGELRLLALSADGSTNNFVTGGLSTRRSWKYGIIQVRAKCTPHESNFPAIWMMPKNQNAGWPDCGEIDIMEQVGTSSNVAVTVHNGAKYSHSVGRQYVFGSSAWFDTDYHVYTLLWDENSLTFYTDERLMLKYTKDSTLDLQSHPEYEEYQFPYNKKFYVILDMAIGLNSYWSEVNPDPDFVYEMRVDYVRVFQKDESMGIKNTTIDSDASTYDIWGRATQGSTPFSISNLLRHKRK